MLDRKSHPTTTIDSVTGCALPCKSE